MTYLDDTAPQDRAKSVAGVIAIHGAVGYALIVGLQFTGVIEEDNGLTSTFIPTTQIDPVEPPPPPPPDDTVEQPQQQQTQTYTPPTPFDITVSQSPIDTTDILPPPSDPIIPRVVPTSPPSPPGNLAPLVDPVAATPRNDAGRWITDEDYRSSWINRGYEGLATFRVTVGTNGRVEDCLVTRSTGHAALDSATCKLVKRRALFKAARDSQGDKVTGSFTSSVDWRIPE